MGYMVPPTGAKPTLDRPYQSESWGNHTTAWSSYPLDREPIQLPLQFLYDQMCQLYVFTSDLQYMLFAEYLTMDAGQKFEAAQAMEEKLQKWYKALPSQFQEDDPDFIVAPATVDLA